MLGIAEPNGNDGASFSATGTGGDCDPAPTLPAVVGVKKRAAAAPGPDVTSNYGHHMEGRGLVGQHSRPLIGGAQMFEVAISADAPLPARGAGSKQRHHRIHWRHNSVRHGVGATRRESVLPRRSSEFRLVVKNSQRLCAL